MQQICRKTPMPKCDFIKVTLQPYFIEETKFDFFYRSWKYFICWYTFHFFFSVKTCTKITEKLSYAFKIIGNFNFQLYEVIIDYLLKWHENNVRVLFQ